MDVGDEMAVKAAVTLVATINSLTETERKKCEQLTLADACCVVRTAVYIAIPSKLMASGIKQKRVKFLLSLMIIVRK